MQEKPRWEIEKSSHNPELMYDAWAMLVIYALRNEPKQLGDLQESIEGISQNMLIQSLRKLEQHSLVERHIYPLVPPIVEYSLTSRGMRTLSMINTTATWDYDTDDPWTN